MVQKVCGKFNCILTFSFTINKVSSGTNFLYEIIQNVLEGKVCVMFINHKVLHKSFNKGIMHCIW